MGIQRFGAHTNPCRAERTAGRLSRKAEADRRMGLGWSLLFFLPVARVLLVLLALLALLALLTLLTLLALLLAIHVLRTLCGLLVRFLIAIRTVLFHLVMVFHC